MTPVDNAAAVLQSGRQFPSLLSEPSFDECIEQGNCYRDDRAAGRIDLRNIPEEHFIAYYGGRVLDHDLDPTALRTRVASSLGIHGARLVIDYPWPW